MLALYLQIAAILALDTVLLAFLAWAYQSPRFASRRISGGAPLRVTREHRLRTMATTSALSLATVLGVTWVLRDQLLHERPTPWWTIALQVVGTVLVYDFTYYFLHRAMHHPKALRFVHGVHHRARNPSALESFYQHPAELLSGLALLFGATWAIGPVHVHAFALTFLVYSTLNILVHSGLAFGTWWLAPIDFLTRKHHTHHADDPHKNYATMTPLPDLLFGTLR